MKNLVSLTVIIHNRYCFILSKPLIHILNFIYLGATLQQNQDIIITSNVNTDAELNQETAQEHIDEGRPDLIEDIGKHCSHNRVGGVVSETYSI